MRFSVDVATDRRARRYARLRAAALEPRARWTAHRKADICMALAGGVVTEEELLAAHGLTHDQLIEWKRGARYIGVAAARRR